MYSTKLVLLVLDIGKPAEGASFQDTSLAVILVLNTE